MADNQELVTHTRGKYTSIIDHYLPSGGLDNENTNEIIHGLIAYGIYRHMRNEAVKELKTEIEKRLLNPASNFSMSKKSIDNELENKIYEFNQMYKAKDSVLNFKQISKRMTDSYQNSITNNIYATFLLEQNNRAEEYLKKTNELLIEQNNKFESSYKTYNDFLSQINDSFWKNLNKINLKFESNLFKDVGLPLLVGLTGSVIGDKAFKELPALLSIAVFCIAVILGTIAIILIMLDKRKKHINPVKDESPISFVEGYSFNPFSSSFPSSTTTYTNTHIDK